MENADVFLGLQDFLDRMRQPSAADFVKSIKSFIVSFSNNPPDPDRDSAAVQEFLSKTESDFRAHPLWSGCSDDELHSAGEGLEKYVMTKLFTRVFASLPDDVKHDDQLSEKMALIQQFIRPENLDIKPNFQNETSWLLAQKELQKINMYRAPRDKLVCILNCCKVISNLLLNASIASNESTPGADEFLPVLIYVTIKANPPQLHSNLLYIQRYRSQSRLVSEAAYYFTNMQSVESFISNIDAKALSMDDAEYEKNMETARALLSGLSGDSNTQSNNQTDRHGGQIPRPASREFRQQSPNAVKDSAPRPRSSESKSRAETSLAKDQVSFAKVPSLSDLENKGAALLLKDDQVTQVLQEYPYLYANSGDLTINDVDDLLNNYKQLVFKYVSLSKGLGSASTGLPSSGSQTQPHHQAEKATNQEETKTIDPTYESPVDTDSGSNNNDLLFEVESLEAKLSQDEAVGEHGGKYDDEAAQS